MPTRGEYRKAIIQYMFDCKWHRIEDIYWATERYISTADAKRQFVSERLSSMGADRAEEVFYKNLTINIASSKRKIIQSVLSHTKCEASGTKDFRRFRMPEHIQQHWSSFGAWLSARKEASKRGITLEERWSIFEGFLTDMGDKPDGHVLSIRKDAVAIGPETTQWRLRSRGKNRAGRNDPPSPPEDKMSRDRQISLL